MNKKNKIICITLLIFVTVILTVIFLLSRKNDIIEQDYADFVNSTEEVVNSTISEEDVLSFVEQSNILNIQDIKIISDANNLKQWEISCDNGDKYVVSVINDKWYLSPIDMNEEAD